MYINAPVGDAKAQYIQQDTPTGCIQNTQSGFPRLFRTVSVCFPGLSRTIYVLVWLGSSVKIA